MPSVVKLPAAVPAMAFSEHAAPKTTPHAADVVGTSGGDVESAETHSCEQFELARIGQLMKLAGPFRVFRL